MHFQKYSNEINRYELRNGYHLQRASRREFTKYWVVYRNVNEDFAQSYTEARKALAQVPFCFWIMSAQNRVGGVVMLPNAIGDFYLIPPENNAQKIVALLMPLLTTWSDPTKPIYAQAIPAPYTNALQSVGFALTESRHWMIRPTETMHPNFDEKWHLATVAPANTKAIAQLLKDAFTGGVGQYGRRDLAAHHASVSRYFEKFDAETTWGQSSIAVHEKESGKLAAVCLVDIHKELPTIRFVAVDPNYQRQGIATQLLKNAINTLNAEYDWVKLAVTITNPAIELYKNLGFIAGDIVCQLSMPIKHNNHQI